MVQAKHILPALVVIIAISVTMALSVHFVPAGYRGVLLTWGAVEGVEWNEQTKEFTITSTPLKEGLQFKQPFVQNIENVQIQTKKFPPDIEVEWKKQEQLISLGAASSDLQSAGTEVFINYHLSGESVHKLYQAIGMDYESVVMLPLLKQIVKEVISKYRAETLIQNREEIQFKIQEQLAADLLALEKCKGCIIVESVSITDFQFTTEFDKAVETKIVAEQDARKAVFDLEKIKVEAQQAEAKAFGEANANIAKANGEAEAIAIINQALKENPNYIEWLKTQRWDGKLPFVVGEGGTPFISIPTGGK